MTRNVNLVAKARLPDGKGKINNYRMQREWNEEEHPGCQLSGYLMVDRAPGNFHIKARS